ncbi:putative transcription factor interactor and regulator C3H-WRC/GRF family [Helianthus annuus]|nr:putative transcription factor interactor and regulator C3H-WRC/GRF family [Helianthus annuus]
MIDSIDHKCCRQVVDFYKYGNFHFHYFRESFLLNSTVNFCKNYLLYLFKLVAGYGVAGQFTPSQWMELEHQALIYKYITANAIVPSNLLIPIRKALETAAFSRGNFRQNTFGWGALHVGFGNGSDPEPGRCRRTDGKKWRCAKNAVGDQKYCERHINRGRHRSRKHVEAQNCHSLSPTTTVAAAKLTTGSAVLSHGIPGSKGASQDNRYPFKFRF